MSAVRFLVADSSPALQTFAKKMLVGFGFEAAWVHTAHSAEAALALAAELPPHFLLTDCFSRGPLTGLQLARQLRASHPSLRWALTSMQLPHDMEREANAQGAMFQLRKPFTAADMQTAMGRALEQWGRDFDEVGRRMPGYRRPRYSGATPPAMDSPTFKPGDLVEYQGIRDTVKNVILSRGELAVQLSNVHGVVPATKLRKA